MDLEEIAAVVVAAILGVAIVARLLPKKMPPRRSFQCSGCGAATLHNDRTAGAWRDGKTNFFCQACHHKWLQSRPPQERQKYSSHGSKRSGSGCLGVIVSLTLPPLVALIYRAYA